LDRTPMEFFVCGHLKQHILCSLLWLSEISWQDFKELLQQLMLIHLGMFERLHHGMLLSPFWWMESTLSTCCNMVWSFDGLHHLMVTCILKTKCHRTCVMQYFDCF
jgi:hypothetical protein